MPLVIGAGFTFAMTESQTLGITYERNLLSTQPAGQDYYTSSGLTSSTRMGFDSQAQWSLVLGQLIRNGSMAYAKLGYASMDTTMPPTISVWKAMGQGLASKPFSTRFSTSSPNTTTPR